jgi:hypothetical protein
VASDIESFGFQLAGRYEQETITMIRKAFEQATPLEAQPSDSNISDPCDGCRYELNSTNGNPCYSCGKYKLTEQQPCEDCISREQALLALTGMDLPTDRDKLIALFTNRIQHLPPVQPQRMQGEWIPIRNYQGLIVAYKCSKCEKTPRRRVKSDYCPNCGADMSGGGEE